MDDSLHAGGVEQLDDPVHVPEVVVGVADDADFHAADVKTPGRRPGVSSYNFV